MPALGTVGLPNGASALSVSLSDQPARPSVLPPLSKKLSVDKELKLSNEIFNETIRDILKDKDITPLSQLTATPPFPTPQLLAQFASKTYSDYKIGENDAQYETRLALPDGWKLLTTASNSSKINGYFGVAYWQPEHQQVVIAHRGTDPTDVGTLWADLKGGVRNQYVRQVESASTFAQKIVEALREVKRVKGVSFQLFFTGYSLGGWLAQVTTFSTQYLKTENKIFDRSNNDQDCCHPHTVVFDSPGCKDLLLKLKNTYFACLDGRSIDLEHLDITSYLSAPNRINTCNTHLGMVCRIFPDMSDMGWWEKLTESYNKATPSRKKILEAFDPETGHVYRDEEGQLKVQVVVDWPMCAGLKRGIEYDTFFELAKDLNNYHPNIKDVSFMLLHCNPIRYQTKIYDERVNSFSIFSEEEQEFLQCYSWLRQWPQFFKPKEMFSALENNQAQDEAEKTLKSFEIKNDTVLCTDSSALQALIPYVKRLLQLFPEIREKTKCVLLLDEVRSRVYQFETRNSIAQINQSPLDFNPDVLGVREILEDEQQQVLKLEMIDGDEWAGLIKVYQILQKTNRLIEGQYTVLRLERLLSLDVVLAFTTLMQSIQEPHLILVACEAKQLLKEKTKHMVRTFFETIKQKPFIKIILTTRSEDRAAHFLQQIGREIFGNGFVARDEHLNWRDLTSSSQEKLLEKLVKFQGAKISLNELMTPESPAANFLPVRTLLKGKELTIADPVHIANGYNEAYYIGRTLRHQNAIKREIYSDKGVSEKHVFLASSEQEFKRICQLYPNSNVHWLEKEHSGILVWQQSQGSLETVRKYIDTGISHTYTADDLDKLLEQAQHQRVMLISDTAGMGKSTVLTHISKQIKQKCLAKWVEKIDLNDHTDVLKVLKQEQMDREKVIEFVSERLLKLKPGLEMELFKQCCEQKQRVRVVIMLDGYDELSPFYKEIVFGLLQALRQTAVEQLWVTTRPHLGRELEDKLQQLSYTLEPFSEENQVAFLTKFWSLKDWFTEVGDEEKEVGKHRLNIYAEHLIKKLANSISDKEREFTGIPLQTRMLAEAFDEDFKKFCQSAESTPDLPFQLDLLGLYGRFIERKYDIYQEEKFPENVNNVVATEQRERDLKSMREDHQLLALKVLFTEEQVALFQNSRECSFSTKDLTRFGIVQVSSDGKPHFIHRNFAEYYVADCLVNCLFEGNKTSQKEQTFILNDIYLGEEYQVIRAFMDGLLSKSQATKEMLKEYGIRMDDKGNDGKLRRSELEGKVNIIEFVSENVTAGGHSDIESRQLQEQETKGRTAWYNDAMECNLQVLDKLRECAKEIQTREKIKNELLLDLIKEGRSVWYVAADWGQPDVLQNVREWAKNNLTTDEIKNKLLLATDSYGNTVLHCAAEWGKLDVLQDIWELAKENLTTEEIKTMLLLATDNKGNTAWHLAIEWGQLDILQNIWEWAKDQLTTEELKCKLLLATDMSGSTGWTKASELGKLDVLQKIWEWAKENLTTQELKNELLLATDDNGNTAWHLAIEWGQLGVSQKIWEWAEENLTTEELKCKLLLATDSDGNTGWHWAAKRGELHVLQKIWEWGIENLTTEEIKNKLLLVTDDKGNTAWHLAVEWGKLDILQKIWELAKENLTTEELKNKLLLATDNKGNTAWHLAIEWGQLDILQNIWEWATENLTTEELKYKLILATDRRGNTAWTKATEWGKQGVLQKVWELAIDTLITEEIKNALLATDYKGNTAWHLAIEWGQPEILQNIWEWATENLTREELKYKLLLATDRRGNTAWHKAAKRGEPEVLQKIIKWAKGNLTTEETNKLLLATNGSGNTAWNRTEEWGKLDVLQKIWKVPEENLTTEEIKNNLLVTDNMGNTA